jgi:hypothetical protein
MNCATTKSLQGRYRPLVRRAWETECMRCNSDPADRAAYDRWYRYELERMAGISTTKGADSKTLETLIEGFLALAGSDSQERRWLEPEIMPHISGFSPAQQAAFNRLVQKAWRKVQDFDPTVNYEAWFNARMRDTMNSTPGISGNHFDRTMGLFGVIAGDDFWIKRTAEASERRIRHVIRAKLAELGRLTQRELDWSYVQGIHDQAKLSLSLDDCPAEYLLSILQMIGSAIAREQRKH